MILQLNGVLHWLQHLWYHRPRPILQRQVLKRLSKYGPR